jgi:SAM-dependent methyltransferase
VPHTIACPVCDGERDATHHAAREMMFGLRHRFTYAECGACGCLLLLDPPSDLERYYPADYYSFRSPPAEAPVRRWLKRRWTAYLLGRPDPVGALLDASRRVRPPGIAAVAAAALAGPTPADPLLDVGSGAYGVLHLLHDAGYRDLTGIDPYLERDQDAGPGLRILKATLEEHDGAYNTVIMSHSLEHMSDHVGALRAVHRLLKPGGALVVRTPVAARTWREFRGDWVELDAPRHLLVHSGNSLRALAARTGFVVERVVHDATADELWGSVQYREDIALHEPRSWLVDPSASPFTRADIARMERRVRRMNQEGVAGRASFLLRRA